MQSSLSAAACAICLLAALPAQASNCVMGAQVTDRKGKTGTVVRMDGANSCYVQFAGEPKPQYYLQWMLKPAGKPGPQAPGGALARGQYTCWAAAGMAGTLKLDITGRSSYAGNGKAGSYRFDEGSQQIRFTSGPWAGMVGARLAPGRIGVSARAGGSYMTTCDLQ